MSTTTEVDHMQFWEQLGRARTHGLQLRILNEARKGLVSPTELATALGEPLGNVAYHVKVLAKDGLLTEHHTVPRRGAVQHYYESTLDIPSDLVPAEEAVAA